jgi:hypothetical protein
MSILRRLCRDIPTNHNERKPRYSLHELTEFAHLRNDYLLERTFNLERQGDCAAVYSKHTRSLSTTVTIIRDYNVYLPTLGVYLCR